MIVGSTPWASTAEIRSLVPSLMYDRDHSASATTSLSGYWIIAARYGSTEATALSGGAGLPRHKFEIVHVMLRRSVTGIPLSPNRSGMCVSSVSTPRSRRRSR
jgi:hypothetical protein